MAIIHSTATLSPTKLELLAPWLPVQPWYLGQGREPELARAGGFRLDDPRGEVGIEFMVVTDGSGERVASYLIPMTYRASALAGADGALIGTAEHGVLGPRWIYDGIRDPVLVAQLVALIQGDAEPQAQSVSDTPDPTVISEPVTSGSLTAIDSAVAASEPSGTVLRVATAGAGGVRGGQLVVWVSRVLQPDGTAAPVPTAASAAPAASARPAASAGPAASVAEAGRPCLTATWRLPDGTRVRGVMASAQYTPLV